MVPLHCTADGGAKHWSECSPTASGMWTPSEVMWPSCDGHATMCHPHHLIDRPVSWWTCDLRVPTNPLYFHSISITLCANASFLAPWWPYTYLFSFPTWRLIVCAPVPCLHPSPLHLHVDSCPSYRYPSVSIPIAYVSLQPCGSILYK